MPDLQNLYVSPIGPLLIRQHEHCRIVQDWLGWFIVQPSDGSLNLYAGNSKGAARNAAQRYENERKDLAKSKREGR